MKSHKENNSESQEYLDSNLPKFDKQCKKLYLFLQSGKRINLKIALNELDIWDLRRRIKDLKDKFGIALKSERMPGGYK